MNSMIIPWLNHSLAYGGDYNPEQWPESVWPEDIRLMREAGVNLVTVGVFSWAKLQPSEKRFDFGWLDRVMDLLAENNIGVCLATATASPPPWMSLRYPDVLAVDASGVTYYPGSRQHYSPCSPTYRRFAAALVKRIAQRYRRHPALAAWHINNEYAAHMAECHSPVTTAAFRVWLKRRYRTLTALNAAWGAVFWSQLYSSWDEIFTPRRMPWCANPTQQLDFKRFMDEATIELYLLERAIIRVTSPNIPITTNFMGFFKPLNYRRWATEMDFVSWDNYPDPIPGRNGTQAAAAAHDLMRSLKKDRPWLLMEQSVSQLTWLEVNGPKPPKLLRLWSWQALARGADGVMFFQWRSSKAGAEKYLTGMVPHGPVGQSRAFAEIKELGAELNQLKPVAGSLVRAEVAIVFDWEAWWAVELDSKPCRLNYAEWARQIHACLYEANIAVDFVSPAEDLSRYKLVVAPALYLLREQDAKNLEQYVKKGGHLLATYFTGIVDENDHVVLGGYPAYLRKVLGLWIEEWHALAVDQGNAFRFAKEKRLAACGHWCEVIHLEGAKVLATYTQGLLAGQPAVTLHNYGSGKAYYLSTKPDPAALSDLLRRFTRAAKVGAVLAVPTGVEVTLRERPDKRFLFLLNHGAKTAKIKMGRLHGRDLATGEYVQGTLEVSPLDARVIQIKTN